MTARLLRIYLNDHLAVAVAAEQTARRSAQANRGRALGPFLEGLADHLRDERIALRNALAGRGMTPSRIKRASGWAAEKVGRLKPNGRLRGYSPLSRVFELESLLMMAAFGRSALERLVELAPSGSEDERAAAALAARSDEVRVELHRWIEDAAAEALLTGAPGA